MNRSRPHVLLVDRDADTRCILRAYLEHNGYSVAEACDLDEARSLAVQNPPGIVIGDFHPDVDRVPLFEPPHTGLGPVPLVVNYTARGLGGHAAARDEFLIMKPATPNDVIRKVERLLALQTH